MNTNIRCSIVLPVYNGAKTLTRCLNSIVKQSLEDYELIIINNGSTDNSTKIIQDFQKLYSNIYLYNLNNKDLISALNLGIEKSVSNYIVRMDCDDTMNEDRLKLQIEYLEQHLDVSLCSSCVQNKSSSKEIPIGMNEYINWNNKLLEHKDIISKIYIESPLVHPSIVARKKDLLDAGGYIDNGLPEDYDLWLRMYCMGYKFYKINKTLLYWWDSPERLTRTHSRYSPESFYKTKAIYLAKSYSNNRDIIVWGAGKYGKIFANYLIEFGINVVGFIDVFNNSSNKKVLGLPVYNYKNILNIQIDLILTAVRNRGARTKIRNYLIENNFKNGIDFIECS